MKDEHQKTLDASAEKENNQASSHFGKDINFFSKDFLFFKNDILKELKILDSKLEEQKKYNLEFKNNFNKYDIKIEKFNEKIEYFSTIINNREAEMNYYNEKIGLLTEFKNKIDQDYCSINNKIKSNAEELTNTINKYDKLIYENLIYPGVIGKNSRFRDFREFIDYTLNNIKIFAIFKDKNITDLKSYKNKLDSIVNSLNYQIQNILSSANSFTLENKKSLEKNLLNEIKLFDEKFIKLRVENLESIKNLENEKKEIFVEWENIKNMKKELTELVDSSLKKINNSNHSIKKNLEKYEKQFNEIKNNISSINNLYNKAKNENNCNQIEDNKNIIKSKDFNNTKVDFNKNSEKNIFERRIQTSKTNLQNYVEENSIINDLMKRSNEKCKQHDYSESKIKLMTLKKYYDEGINNIKNISVEETINDIMNKNSISLTEKNRMSETMNNTPKTSINLNKMKQKFEEYKKDESYSKKEKIEHSKSRKILQRRKFILTKEGYNDINNKTFKPKYKDAEKRIHQSDKFIDQFVDKNRISKLKQLSSISFLYDDIKNKKNKFPKIEKNENNKEDELFLKCYQKINKKKQYENLKYKDLHRLSGFKHSDKKNSKILKTKIKDSADIILINENGDNNSINIFNMHNNISMNNEYNSEVNKKLNERLIKPKKSSEFNKHLIYKLKSEINK